MRNKLSVSFRTFRSVILLLLLLALFGFFGLSVSAGSMSGSGDWVYRTEGLTMTAENLTTGETASVTLDADGTFLKDRTGLPMTDSSIFRENGWTGKEGIEDYHLLYEGETASGVAYSALTPPADPGSYTVRIVLYKVKYDPEAGWFSTEKMYFYQASIAEGSYTVKEHTAAEKAAAKGQVAISEDGYYQVGTAEELLYVATSCGMNANIEITRDIVYNPVSPNADYKVLSASGTVYTWVPLGTESEPYTGNIRGNGHTIYGLVNLNGEVCCGMVGVGKGCSITDLTLSDCQFGGNWWNGSGSTGVFAGRLLLQSDDGHEICFKNLTAHNCVFSGNIAGGIIGACQTVEANDITITKETYSEKRNYLTIENCISESLVNGRTVAGGILGKLSGGTVVTVSDCISTGKIYSGEAVGGILGETSGLWQRLVFRRSANTAEMNCSTEDSQKMGGVVGYLNRTAGAEYDLSSLSGVLQTYREDDCSCYFNDVVFEKCCSMGIGYSIYAGGITGLVAPDYLTDSKQGSLWAISCMGVQSNATETAAFVEEPIIFSYEGEAYQYNTSAEKACSLLGHFPGTVGKVTGGSTCGEAGTWAKHCLLCGAETETAELPVHEHFHADGTHCEYCSAELTACASHKYEYGAYGNRVYARCTVCHETESVWFEISGEKDPTDTNLFLCGAGPDIVIRRSEGWGSSLPLARLVFTSPTGAVTYDTLPADPNAYGTVYLQVYTGKIKAVTKAVTEPVAISGHWHDWEYSASGVTLFAKCSHCGESASVTMDGDGANAANLNALKYQHADYDYEIFIDNGWMGQKGIADYYILYDGTSVSEDYMTGIKCDAFRRPTDAGSYSARAALLTNSLDPKTVYLSTDSVSYYISTVPFAQCERKDYSDAELNRIYAECEPALSSDGWYQVGTRDELLWLIITGKNNANINITADIVVNPITVNEETGDVLCGAYDIFNWVPLGWFLSSDRCWKQYDAGFTGKIRGNGHTISGLYNVNKNKHMGFISIGKGCTVTNLTLENCVFSATEGCGTFFGTYYTETPDLSQMTLSGLSAYRCYVTATSYAGGIIGMVYPSYSPEYGGDRQIPGPSTYLPAIWFDMTRYSNDIHIVDGALLKHNYFILRDCISGCTVNGGVAAGGIVGTFNWGTVVTVEDCTNFGHVESGKSAGGILGLIFNKWQRLVIRNCVNGGTVKGSENIGGIAGLIDAKAHYSNRDPDYDYKRLTEYLEHGSSYSLTHMCYFNDTLIENCTSIGPLGVGTYTGGIVGYYDMNVKDYVWGSATMIDCKYSQTRNAIGGSNSSGFTFDKYNVSSVMAEKISDSTAISYICKNLGGHTAEAKWEYDSGLGCEKERTAVLKCRLCGEVLQTKTVPAHSHQLVKEKCNFCGAAGSSTASVFSDNRKLLIPMAGVVILVMAVLVFYGKKVKKSV